jgi:hypothetical protein
MTSYGSQTKQFNTSSIRSAISNVPDAHIADWYEVHYLSVCSGMWNAVGGDKNQSTVACVHQKAGYTFSLAQTLGGNAAQLLPANSSYGTIDSNDSRILLTIGITLAGVSLTSLLYGVVVLLLTSTPPLLMLRIGYMASIPTMVVLTISSAKITSIADKMTGATEISPGIVVHAWMGPVFYVTTWLSAGFMWAAVGFSITAGFKIAIGMEVEKARSRRRL